MYLSAIVSCLPRPFLEILIFSKILKLRSPHFWVPKCYENSMTVKSESTVPVASCCTKNQPSVRYLTRDFFVLSPWDWPNCRISGHKFDHKRIFSMNWMTSKEGWQGKVLKNLHSIYSHESTVNVTKPTY